MEIFEHDYLKEADALCKAGGVSEEKINALNEKHEREELIYEALCPKVGEGVAREKAQVCAELIYAMKTSVVKFTFRKSCGEIREAVGTICPELLPPLPEEDPSKPKRERTPNYGVVNYYDTEKQSWRSFKAENIISAEC